MVEFIEKEFKSILLIGKFINSWYWERDAFNPYNGCQHGCVYCDSHGAKYHLRTDFENAIIVKHLRVDPTSETYYMEESQGLRGPHLEFLSYLIGSPV